MLVFERIEKGQIEKSVLCSFPYACFNGWNSQPRLKKKIVWVKFSPWPKPRSFKHMEIQRWSREKTRSIPSD